MQLSKKIARNFVFPVLKSANLDRFLLAVSDKQLLNVMYHGVVKVDSTNFSPRHILDSQFEEQIKYFKKNFDILSIEEAFEVKKRKEKLKRKAVTITFDDGYLNNLTTALPILESYQVPVTFFISSACITNMTIQTLWSDLVAMALYGHKTIEVNGILFEKGYSNNLGKNVYDYIKTLDVETRDKCLEKIILNYNLKEAFNKLPNEMWQMLNANELKKMADSKIVTIGSHGHLHYNLGNIPLRDAKIDITNSIQLLEACIGKKINAIAYPDGSYTDEVKDEAEKLGLIYQFAVNYKSKNDTADPRIMNRHGISSTTTFASNILYLSRSFQKKGI
jgi:peptidoglycan/xylan/chitin deacetylase (PgdA/CDA1 family)